MTAEEYDTLPFTTSEDDWPPAVVVEREPRKCRRHQWWMPPVVGPDAAKWDFGSHGPVCRRCGRIRDEAVSRRGKLNRSRGNSIEREVAHRLGLRRVGQYGGLADAEAEWLVVQVKSGGAYPERIDKLLRSLTANANQLRAVVHADAPGPGHRRRALVTVDLDDFLAWFGGSSRNSEADRG
jgi:hypothetical protein